MSIFSTTVIQDAETALKDLASVSALVKSGSLNPELLDALVILDPFISLMEKEYPLYADAIAWAETFLKNELSK